jgi:hypothetical protein
LNAALQCLRQISKLATYLGSTIETDEKVPLDKFAGIYHQIQVCLLPHETYGMTRHLQQLTKLIEQANKPPPPKDRAQQGQIQKQPPQKPPPWKRPLPEPPLQHDPHELMLLLLDRLEIDLKPGTQANLIDRLFNGHSRVTFGCPQCARTQ